MSHYIKNTVGHTMLTIIHNVMVLSLVIKAKQLLCGSVCSCVAACKKIDDNCSFCLLAHMQSTSEIIAVLLRLLSYLHDIFLNIFRVLLFIRIQNFPT